MKIQKRLLCPERLRRIPGQFSWVDQRLVRDRYLEHCDQGALALYLVLLTVADAEGLSYYSDASLQRMLKMPPAQLASSRKQLCQAGLLAYEKPLYQILSLELPLDAGGVGEPPPRAAQTMPVAQILSRIFNGRGGA